MLVKNIQSKYLTCNIGFGPFEKGQRFYCTSIADNHFHVMSEKIILGVNTFKIHIEHIDKFIIMS